jgi:hypothetical protein
MLASGYRGRTQAATRTPTAPHTCESTNAGVGPVSISDVLIANLAHDI